jgi:acetylornithine deacetylase/succinyl-diaminopimelate desuccinylase-like protein
LAPLAGVSVAFHRSQLRCYTGPELEVDNFHPAWAQPEDSEMAIRCQGALRAAGQAGALWLAPYSTNGVAAAAERGLPTVLYGAGSIDQAHAVDEAIEIDQLRLATLGYQALAQALAQATA